CAPAGPWNRKGVLRSLLFLLIRRHTVIGRIKCLPRTAAITNANRRIAVVEPEHGKRIFGSVAVCLVVLVDDLGLAGERSQEASKPITMKRQPSNRIGSVRVAATDRL